MTALFTKTSFHEKGRIPNDPLKKYIVYGLYVGDVPLYFDFFDAASKSKTSLNKHVQKHLNRLKVAKEIHRDQLMLRMAVNTQQEITVREMARTTYIDRFMVVRELKEKHNILCIQNDHEDINAHVVYGLIADDQIFYIGRTGWYRQGERLREHLADAVKGTSEKCQRIRMYQSRGHQIGMKVLDKGTLPYIITQEAMLISEYRDLRKHNLANGNDARVLTPYEERSMLSTTTLINGPHIVVPPMYELGKPKVDEVEVNRLVALAGTDKAAYDAEMALIKERDLKITEAMQVEFDKQWKQFLKHKGPHVIPVAKVPAAQAQFMEQLEAARHGRTKGPGSRGPCKKKAK